MQDTMNRPNKVRPMVTCGFCAFGGNHQSCPGGVRNGDGSIVPCRCTVPGCRAGQPRCTDCNNREAGTIGEDWRCINKDDCQATQEIMARRNPVVMRVRAIREAHGKSPEVADGPEAREGAPRSSRGQREPGKPCTCGCGQTTGGGRFRPGHDSTYMNKLLEQAKASGAAAAEAQGLADQISEAFGRKFTKRMEK